MAMVRFRLGAGATSSSGLGMKLATSSSCFIEFIVAISTAFAALVGLG
jgi:hypothetical protein